MSVLSLNRRVVEALGQAIVNGELAPGSVITLDELQTRFAVSRTVARDAVKTLEAQSLVRPQRRIGVSVLPSESWNALAPAIIRWRLAGPHRMRALAELAELRLGIEPSAAALAASRATLGERLRLDTAVAGMAAAAQVPDLNAYLDADKTFHRALLEASHNPLFANLGTIVDEVLTGRTEQGLMPATPNPEAIELHRTAADAISSGDAEAARAAMRAIVAEALVGAAELDRSVSLAPSAPADR